MKKHLLEKIPLCDFITEIFPETGYTQIKQKERGWHNGSEEYQCEAASGAD